MAGNQPPAIIGDPRNAGLPTIPGREIGPASARTVTIGTAPTQLVIGAGKYHIDLHYATSTVRGGNTDNYLKCGGSDCDSGGAGILYQGQTFQYRNVTSDFSIYLASLTGDMTLDVIEYETTPET